MAMVAIEINEHLIVRQFGCTALVLVRLVDADIGLVEFVDGIINDDVDLAAVFVVEQV